MKTFVTIVLVSFFISGIILPQINYDLHDVQFLNDNRGFITGTDGLMLRTTDAGETWEQLTVPAPNDLGRIYFSDSLRGIVHDYKTTDGGDTWFMNPAPTRFEYYVNDSVGYANAIVPYILKTTNGGVNWFEVNTEYTDDLYLSGFHFYNEEAGFALSDFSPNIFRTTNGGTTWNKYSFCDTCTGFLGNKDLTMFDDANGVFARSYYLTGNSPGDTIIYNYPDIVGIWKTTDSGYTWNPLPPVPAGSKDMYFIDINNGWLCGDSGKVFKTTNGGTSWLQLTSPVIDTLLSVFFTDLNTGFVVGRHNSIYKTTDGGITWNLKLIGDNASDKKSFLAVLLGENVTPPVITDGSGGAMFVLNSTQDTLWYWIRICELKCPYTNAYFRYGAPGTSGTILKDLTYELLRLPGSLDVYGYGIWTSSDYRTPFTKEMASILLAGYLYIDIRTTGYPSGEIRGQVKNNQPVHLFANLDGSQEVPPVNTLGSGEGWFTLSGDGDSLYYNVRAYDLTSPVTAAHFHKASVDSSGPPVKPISFMGDSLSEGWWTNMDANPLTPELVADLLGCYLYVNIHTSNHPAGEIRGQLYKTDEVPMNFMTMLAAENDADENNYSKLSYYTLQEGKPFHNYEGDITGYDGQKNIVDMTIDIGGNVYFLNNSWTSMLYRIRPEQFDFNEETVLRAKQMGRLRTSPDDSYKWMTNIQFIKGKLYGFDSKTNKLYNINPNNAHVTEIAEISSIGTGTAGFALGADGNVYLLKNIDEKRSEIWKFNKFPSTELTLVTEVPSLGKLNTLSAHPNGNLYSTCTENLYEINLSNKTIGVLKDHKITASAMDFDYFTEKQTAVSGTIPFTNLDGVTAVGDFTEMPKKYELAQNYPNPFNPGTTIKYALPEASFVKLVVYNSLGEVVRTLVNDNRSAGYYETVFDAKDLSSGMYIYRLEAGSFVSTAKMILMK